MPLLRLQIHPQGSRRGRRLTRRRSWTRSLAQILSVPAFLLLAYGLAALLGAMIPSGAAKPATGPRSHQVLLVAGPIHYDFLIPLDPQVRRQFGFLAASGLAITDPRSEWLVIGWGAREFYTTIGDYRDIELSAIVKGALGDRSVLRVDVLGALPPLPDMPKIGFTDAEFDALLSAMASSFEAGPAQQVQRLPHSGFTHSDAFFAAKGRFHLFRTCNTWVAQMIRASGRRFGAWTPLPYSVRLAQRLYRSD